MGFRTVSLKHNSYSVKIYDVGGSSQIRALWPKYYNDVSNTIAFSKQVTMKLYMNEYHNEMLLTINHLLHLSMVKEILIHFISAYSYLTFFRYTVLYMWWMLVIFLDLQKIKSCLTN